MSYKFYLSIAFCWIGFYPRNIPQFRTDILILIIFAIARYLFSVLFIKRPLISRTNLYDKGVLKDVLN